MNLVVGATGMLGGQIVHRLVGSGKPVKALVRTTAAATAVEDLKALGIDVVEGDLRDPASLTRACQGVATAISTATAISGHQPGTRSLRSTSWTAEPGRRRWCIGRAPPHLHVVLRQPSDPEPLGDSKRAGALPDGQPGRLHHPAPDLLHGGLAQPLPRIRLPERPGTHLRIRPQPHQLDLVAGRGRVRGPLRRQPRREGQGPRAGRPEPLSPLAVVRIFEESGGRPFTVEHVPEDVLSAQLEQADNDVSKSVIGLMLDYARGDAKDMTEVLGAFPIRLTAVRDYATRVLAG